MTPVQAVAGADGGVPTFRVRAPRDAANAVRAAATLLSALGPRKVGVVPRVLDCASRA